jgi:hypothetical protein
VPAWAASSCECLAKTALTWKGAAEMVVQAPLRSLFHL